MDVKQAACKPCANSKGHHLSKLTHFELDSTSWELGGSMTLTKHQPPGS